MKKCAICETEFDDKATGPWCHPCVGDILNFLRMSSSKVAALYETVERIRQQLRDAKKTGLAASTTEVPGPYWGLDLE